jgi:hypothetical protein
MKITVYEMDGHGHVGKRLIKEMVTPAGATAIKILCVNENGFIPDSSVIIPVPRPKVKKWRFERAICGALATTNKHFSDVEAHELMCNGWTKEWNTEVEE